MPNNIILGHGISEPIGLEYIQSAIANQGYNVVLKNRFELEVTGYGLIKTISLFSATSPEWDFVLTFANEARKRGNISVIGGYHVTGLYHSGILRTLPFDYIVIGEGEEIILDLLNEIKNNKKSTISHSSKLYIANQIENINSLPFPTRYPAFLSDYKIFDLMFPSTSNQKNTAIILGSRGCSNNCSFCASSSMWGSRIRLRNTESIIEEIRFLKSNYETNTLVFVDQCFGVNKDWTKELCLKLIKSNVNINWYIQTNISIEESLIPLMAEAGCTKIGFGVEGISPTAIKIIKPNNNKSLEELNHLFTLCNNYGLMTKTYLMLGFPWETKDIIDEYLEWLPKLEANMIKISFFTPFPGTKDWFSYNNRLVTNNWSDFDTVKIPVVYNSNISVNEYLEYRKELFWTFYSSATFRRLSSKLIEKYPFYHQSYIEFFGFLKQFLMLPPSTNVENWLNVNTKSKQKCK